MKRINAVLLAAALMMTGCAGGNGKPLDKQLMAGANTNNSAVILYEYTDGETTVGYVFDDRAELVNAVNSAKVYSAPEDADLSALNGTFYGITCYGDGEDIGGTWADGIWVALDGSVYRTDLDPAAIFAAAQTTENWTTASPIMPSMYWFATYGGKWNTRFLSKAEELSPRGLELTISSIEDGKIHAALSDTTGEEQCVGQYYTLQAQADSEWYDIPTKTELCFNDLGYIIPANGSVDFTYYTEAYGELPAGVYRVVAEGAAAEFTVE